MWLCPRIKCELTLHQVSRHVCLTFGKHKSALNLNLMLNYPDSALELFRDKCIPQFIKIYHWQ